MLHETKKVVQAIVKDSPGNSPDAFIKLYDRDDFCNTVLGQGSKFINDNPFFVFFGGSHLEDYHEIFGTPMTDALGVHFRLDSFHLYQDAPEKLEDFGLMDQDDSIYICADVLELIENQFPRLTRAEAKEPTDYSQRLGMWRLQQGGGSFREHFALHSKAAKEAQEVARNSDEKDDVRAKAKGLQSYHSKMATKPCRYAPAIHHLVKAWAQKDVLQVYKQEALDAAAGAGAAAQPLDAKAREKMLYMPLVDYAARMAKEDAVQAASIGLPYWERSTGDEAASLAHAIVHFLSDQGLIVEKFLAAPLGAVVKSTTGVDVRDAKGDVTLVQGNILFTQAFVNRELHIYIYIYIYMYISIYIYIYLSIYISYNIMYCIIHW